MSRKPIALLATFAALMACVALASTAHAEGGTWWIAGSPFKGVAEMASTTKIVANFKLEMHGEKSGTFTIECKGLKLKNTKIENGNERSDESDVYESCFVVGKPECSVASTASEPLKAVIEGSTGAFKLKFSPKTGTRIAAWKVSGATCAQAGNFEANGTMICNYKGVETEAPSHPLEFTATSGSKVTVGGVKSEFTLTYEDQLKTGQEWSVQ